MLVIQIMKRILNGVNIVLILGLLSIIMHVQILLCGFYYHMVLKLYHFVAIVRILHMA